MQQPGINGSGEPGNKSRHFFDLLPRKPPILATQHEVLRAAAEGLLLSPAGWRSHHFFRFLQNKKVYCDTTPALA